MTWLQGGTEIITDFVGRGLEEDALVAKRVKVELQRFELHAGFVRYVADRDVSKVRVARHRTDRRKFVMRVFDQEITMRSRIGKSFEDLWIGHCGTTKHTKHTK